MLRASVNELQTIPTGCSGFPVPAGEQPDPGHPLRPVAPFPPRLYIRHHEHHSIPGKEEGMCGMRNCEGEMRARDR